MTRALYVAAAGTLIGALFVQSVFTRVTIPFAYALQVALLGLGIPLFTATLVASRVRPWPIAAMTWLIIVALTGTLISNAQLSAWGVR